MLGVCAVSSGNVAVGVQPLSKIELLGGCLGEARKLEPSERRGYS